MSNWTIAPVTPETLDEVVTFVNNARTEMFPALCAQLNDNVARWINSGFFLMARKSETLIAVIGFVPYDHRFSQLKFREVSVVEVVRLYVLPEFRRCGLAATIFAELRKQAKNQGIECFYLHTHPFLPGAITFWEKRGFEVVDVEDDPNWKTTHMQMSIDREE